MYLKIEPINWATLFEIRPESGVEIKSVAQIIVEVLVIK